jgi:hypothetical protein
MANRRASKTASSKRGLINTGRDSTLSGDYCPGRPILSTAASKMQGEVAAS